MKFVLNTSFDPHFCALFDAQDNPVAKAAWAIPRQDGQAVWDFLNQYLPPDTTLSFIGGVTGPGSFSSLRTAGAVLNSLSFKFKIPIHQARADKAIQDYLNTTEHAQTPFLLNSFSQRVFVPQNGQLKVLEINQATAEIITPCITSWLPEAKATQIKNSVNTDPLGPLKTILGTLENSLPQPQFIADYEYPPVQN